MTGRLPTLRATTLAMVLLLARVAPSLAAPHPASTPETSSLQTALARLAAGAPGRCAIAAWHFQPDGSGLRVAEVNGDRAQVLGSVYKLPIAVKVLADVDAGRLSLDRELTLRDADYAPGWSPIAVAHPGGVTLTVAALLDSMLVASDNSACDALLGVVGGPRAVTAWLRAHGVTGVRVDRSERQQGDAWSGVAPLPAGRAPSRVTDGARRDAVPPARRAAARAFVRDPRDHGSAHALADLLRRLWLGELLSDASRQRLWSAMERTPTGPRRLHAGLPQQAKLFHKTGTGGTMAGVTAAVNDVGIVRLPGGGGIVVIAVLVEEVRGVERAEDVIAEAARIVFEHWNAPD